MKSWFLSLSWCTSYNIINSHDHFSSLTCWDQSLFFRSKAFLKNKNKKITVIESFSIESTSPVSILIPESGFLAS